MKSIHRAMEELWLAEGRKKGRGIIIILNHQVERGSLC